MIIHCVKASLEDFPNRLFWVRSKRAAGAIRKQLRKKGWVIEDSFEADIPTSKSKLIQWLNGNFRVEIQDTP